MSASADALIRELPRVTLVVGKGGVGKTTTAAALALRSSQTVGRTLLLTTDPARALPAVLNAPVGPEPAALPFAPALDARLLDAAPLRTRFMERHGDVLRLILDRGTYLDDSDIAPLVDTAMPGSDEIFAALALAELVASAGSPYARIVVDTAPTGHTLRLLQLPRTFRALVALLEAMQDKHRFMVRTLTRAYRADAADAFLREMTALVDALEQTLTDRQRCAAVLVAHPDGVVMEETRRYRAALDELGIEVAAIVWNATSSAADFDTARQYLIPTLPQSPTGAKGLTAWLDAFAEVRRSSVKGRQPTAESRESEGSKPRAASRELKAESREPRAVDLAALIRPLTIVAGKGGVGKTTVAAALALEASRKQRTLVVSTDPAPSLADVLDLEIGDSDTPIADVPSLHARQMDASAAFTRLRDEYRTRVDAVFDGLVTSGVNLASDRAIVRDLLALAPPGVDEVYALSVIADALFQDRYERVIVDPAPTGHLLRLLEMPQLALAWCHQLLRLMLKYKDVAGLGESAAEILDFSRKLRALEALLHDPARAGVVLVTLDQPVVLDESERLAVEVRRLQVPLIGVVLNRADADVALPELAGPVQLQAPRAEPPPIGVDNLRKWSARWTRHAARQASRG